MKNLLLTSIVVLFSISLLNCTHKSYDEVPDFAEWRSLEDGDEVECYVRIADSIYWSGLQELECILIYYDPLEVDVETFKVAEGCEYAKDKNNVYYPWYVVCTDCFEDINGCYDGCHAVEYVVKGADPKTFKYLFDDYGIDRYHMYRSGKKISWDNEVIQRAKSSLAI